MFVVEEEIVRIAAGVNLGNQLASLPVKRCEFGGTSEHDKDTLAFSVERHRKVSAVSKRPVCPLLARRRVNHRNGPAIWQIHKYLACPGIELKAFRMHLQGD